VEQNFLITQATTTNGGRLGSGHKLLDTKLQMTIYNVAKAFVLEINFNKLNLIKKGQNLVFVFI
jgi:hypothetical protein